MSTNAVVVKPMGALAQALTSFRDGLRQTSRDASNSIAGVTATGWFSPGQPIIPIAPVGTQPRRIPFAPGQNQIFTPRPDAEYTAMELKKLASYDLVRVIIENTKDQICRIKPTFQLKPKPGETKRDLKQRSQEDTTLVKLSSFFEYPDGENDFSTWVRPLLEDMLVIDAASVLVTRTVKKKQIARLDVMRGETFTRYIDQNGFTPRPPSPAYAQLLYGMPAVNLTTDDLVYRPRNIVPRESLSSQLYGMSPTEQAAQWIRIGAARLNFQEEYYKSGSVPGLMHIVPADISPEKIGEAMEWMNSRLSGNLAERRQYQMVQGFQKDGKPDQLIFSKEALLSDPFDDLIIRCLCFAFGTSPQRLMRMMNRATAQQADESAQQEGLWPWLSWLTSFINYIVQRLMGLQEYEVNFQPHVEVDVVKQAQADEIRLKSQRNSINEVREAAGEDPRPEPQAEMIGTITANGFVPITQEVVQSAGDTTAVGGEGEDEEDAGGKPGAKPAKPGKPGAKPSNGNGGAANKAHCDSHSKYDDACLPCAQREVRRLEKAAPPAPVARALFLDRNAPRGPVGFHMQPVTPVVPALPAVMLQVGKASSTVRHDTDAPTFQHGNLTMQSIAARRDMEGTLNAAFKRMLDKTKKVLEPHFSKAQSDDDNIRKLTIKELMGSLEEEWSTLPPAVRKSLEQSASSGVNQGMLQIEITNNDILSELNVVARDWASNRAAELVGMRYNDNGDLVRNTRARYAISSTTRDELREIITEAFEEDTKYPDLVQSIEDAGTFSEERAAMIARTEVSRAQGYGNLEVWKQSGVVEQVDWINSMEPNVCPECMLLAMGSPYDIDDVPEFPHPFCQCNLIARVKEDA